MAANPKGTCSVCRKIQEFSKVVTNNMRKHVMIYAFFYLLVLELGSFVIRENTSKENYDEFWFPLLVQFSFFIIFLNLFLFRDILKFCKRKIYVVASLTIYYLLNFTTVVFPICNSTYVFYFSVFLLLTVYIIILQTIYKNLKK